jgi:hypothetical protein
MHTQLFGNKHPRKGVAGRFRQTVERSQLVKVGKNKMKTKIHAYSFDLEKVEDREPWVRLSAMLTARKNAGHQMSGWSPDRDAARNHAAKIVEYSGQEITIEPEHLFSNQWNTTECGRVFDWSLEYIGDSVRQRLIKRGHYLEITPEMEEARENTLKCGYTGAQFPSSAGMKFNTTQAALGSCFLKEEEIYLLRLVPVFAENTSNPRAKLTTEEKNFLLPLYLSAQSRTRGEARKEQRAAVEKEFADDSRRAKIEYEGKIWLLDHGVNLENAIFYNHTERFCFGWRNAYGENAAQAMRAALNGFPFAFDIETEGAK